MRFLGGLAAALVALAPPAAAAGPQPPPNSSDWQFVSAPDLRPPRVTPTDAPAYEKLQRGYFLETAGGLEVLDSRLQLVWYKPGPVHDLKLQSFDGKPVLTWWLGQFNSYGVGSGVLYVVDEHYRVIATLRAAHGWSLDMHEAVLDGHDAWVTVYRTLQDAKYGSSPTARRGLLLDYAIQEYDLRTHKLLRTWDPLNAGKKAHVPLSESQASQPDAAEPTLPWDPYHINSIQLIGAHDLLVSMRDTSAVYLVDIKTGKIVWTLGGKRSSFKMPASAVFKFQHDVSLHPGGVVTMFDNECCLYEPDRSAIPYEPSRGLILKLNFKRRRATLLNQYLHVPSVYAGAEGSMQLLANGNVLVGWGTDHFFSEYSRGGTLLLDAQTLGSSYRDLLGSVWAATPRYPPSAVIQTTGATKTLYVSWNGATTVASWQVLGGSDPAHLTAVAKAPKAGFETAIPLPSQSFTVVQVRALDAKGHTLGSRLLTVP